MAGTRQRIILVVTLSILLPPMIACNPGYLERLQMLWPERSGVLLGVSVAMLVCSLRIHIQPSHLTFLYASIEDEPDTAQVMVQCDICWVWQHITCMGIEAPPDDADYFCERCRPDLHQNLLKYAPQPHILEPPIEQLVLPEGYPTSLTIAIFPPTSSVIRDKSTVTRVPQWCPLDNRLTFRKRLPRSRAATSPPHPRKARVGAWG